MRRYAWAGFAGALGAVALVGLALRLAYVLVPAWRPALGFDGTWYALQAGTVADGIGYVDPFRFYSFQGVDATANFPPLWPGLLAIVHDLGFGSRTAYRVTGALLGTAGVVLTGFLGRTLLGARVGVVGAALVAGSPLVVAADGSLMAESLFSALVTASVLVGVKARRTGRLAWFAGLGLLLGLATLTRGDGLVVALVLVPVVTWGSDHGAGRRLARAGVAIALLAVTLTPWAVRNERELGAPIVLSSNSGALVAGANCAPTYFGSDLAGWKSECVRSVVARTVPEVERSDALRAAGVRYVREHWLRAAMVAPLRVARGWGLWDPRALIEAEAVESRTRTLLATGWGVSLVVLGAAAVGAVRLVRARAEVAELLAVVGAASLVLAGSWGNQRFRLVATPEIALLAAFTLLAVWDRLRRDRAPADDARPTTAGEPAPGTTRAVSSA